MNKKCPKCGRNYGELSNYCTMCGLELEKAISGILNIEVK